MTPREEIGYGLDALVIFRSLQQDPVLRALMQFCHTDKENTPAQIRFGACHLQRIMPEMPAWVQAELPGGCD